MEKRDGFNQTELDALMVRLDRLVDDPEVTSIKVKVVYQERKRPGRWEGREFKILEDIT